MRQHRSFGLLLVGLFGGCKSFLSFRGPPNCNCKPFVCQTLAASPNLLWDWALGSGGCRFSFSGFWRLGFGSWIWGLAWTVEVWALEPGLGPGPWGLGFGSGGFGVWGLDFEVWRSEVGTLGFGAWASGPSLWRGPEGLDPLSGFLFAGHKVRARFPA